MKGSAAAGAVRALFCPRPTAISRHGEKIEAGVALRQTTRHRCSRQAGCALAPTLAYPEIYEPLRNSDKTLAKLPKQAIRHCLLTVDTHPLEVVYALVG